MLYMPGCLVIFLSTQTAVILGDQAISSKCSYIPFLVVKTILVAMVLAIYSTIILHPHSVLYLPNEVHNFTVFPNQAHNCSVRLLQYSYANN